MLAKPFIFQTLLYTGPPKLDMEHLCLHMADHFHWPSKELKQTLEEKWARQSTPQKCLEHTALEEHPSQTPPPRDFYLFNVLEGQKGSF